MTRMPPGEVAARYLTAPVRMVTDTEYVDTEVLDNGDLLVTHWIRTSLPMSQLTLTVPSGAGLDARAVDVGDLVVAADGVLVDAPARGAADAEWAGTLPDARDLFVQYQLSGTVQLSGSAAGRALATATSLSVGVGGQPLARTQAFAGSRVLTLACLAPGEEAIPTPCGTFVEGTWTLDHDADTVPETVIAQLDLEAAPADR